MKTILVPLDGSPLAEHAIAYARGLAALLEARLQLLRVISDAEVERGDMFGYDLAAIYGVAEAAVARQEQEERMRGMLRERAEAYLELQAEPLRKAGMDVGVEVRFGPPADVIVETAEGEHVAMIAMATHGYSGLRRWALGSTADKVVHATATPCLLVRGEAPWPETPPLQRILVPLDGSALSKQALPLAAEIAVRAGAEIVLLRAIVPAVEIAAGIPPAARLPALYEDLTEPMRVYAQAELDATAAELRAEVPSVVADVPFGDPGEVIVDEALERHAGLIVMATHGYSGLRRWALGSTADKVMHATVTPLLLVRAKE